jgi:hypothetical protein
MYIYVYIYMYLLSLLSYLSFVLELPMSLYVRMLSLWFLRLFGFVLVSFWFRSVLLLKVGLRGALMCVIASHP